MNPLGVLTMPLSATSWIRKPLTPGGRLPGYEDVAAAIEFLAGPHAGGITGATLTVDRGFSAGQRVRYIE